MNYTPKGKLTPDWIDEDLGRVSRRIFSDPQIYDLEIERIFNKTWLFLGHESELPEAGDYVVRPMGTDQVIVVRGDDGVIRGFLNACAHRGMTLCRANSGRTKRFVCPYHAWAFDTKGALRTTTFDQHYQKDDPARLGLTPIAQVDTYRGLIFGNWDADADPLSQHLGDLRWYLDMLFARTPKGMSVIGAPQRWVMETNWKIPAINFLDSQHALRTHAGPMSMAEEAGSPPLNVVTKIADATPQITFPQGHGVVLAPWPELGLPDFFGYPPEVVPLFKEALAPDQWEQLRTASPSVGTIFPNTSWVESPLAVDLGAPPRMFFTLRTWQPLDAGRIEVCSWYFAEVEASEENRTKSRQLGMQTFGVGGTFEEDDAEVWASIVRSTRGSVASQGYMDFSGGREEQPLEGYTKYGTAYRSQLSEHAQFNFMKKWMRQMSNDQSGVIA